MKKEFKSKTAVTKCGYCSVQIKEENLESHCKTAHNKPKLSAGHNTLDDMFKGNKVVTEAPSIFEEPELKYLCHHPKSKSLVTLK